MEKILEMTKNEALERYGSILQPIEAAEILSVRQPSINDYWKSGTLTHLKIKRAEKVKSYCIATEVHDLRKKREKKVKKLG